MPFEPETVPADDTNPAVQLIDAVAATQQDLPFRLLKDELVLGTFPIAKKSRPLGKLAAFLFITDSRVIYAAESKSITSSSTDLREYQVQSVNGIQVSRHRGLDALGVAVALGSIFNFLGWLSLGAWLGAVSEEASQSYYLSGANPASPMVAPCVALGILALIFGGLATLLLFHNVGEVNVVGPQEARAIVKQLDWPRLFIVIILFVVFGIFVGLALVIWVVLRELGVFKATDASMYADTRYLDNISYEAGALILDVQARGKLAGQ